MTTVGISQVLGDGDGVSHETRERSRVRLVIAVTRPEVVESGNCEAVRRKSVGQGPFEGVTPDRFGSERLTDDDSPAHGLCRLADNCENPAAPGFDIPHPDQGLVIGVDDTRSRS
jgi:hypothetical protein